MKFRYFYFGGLRNNYYQLLLNAALLEVNIRKYLHTGRLQILLN